MKNFKNEEVKKMKHKKFIKKKYKEFMKGTVKALFKFNHIGKTRLSCGVDLNENKMFVDANFLCTKEETEKIFKESIDIFLKEYTEDELKVGVATFSDSIKLMAEEEETKFFSYLFLFTCFKMALEELTERKNGENESN